MPISFSENSSSSVSTDSTVTFDVSCGDGEINRLSQSRPSTGAKLKTLRKTSWKMIFGEASTLDIVCEPIADPSAAALVTPTVCRMSPSWHVTAVQGNVPINVPAMQSRSDTPVTPQAMLRADQGTTPTRRRTDNRTHAGLLPVFAAASVASSFSTALATTATLGDDDEDAVRFVGRKKAIESNFASDLFDSDDVVDDLPSSAAFVSSIGFGKNRMRKGANGIERRVAQVEPIVVKDVMTNVATSGWKRAPARTFCAIG